MALVPGLWWYELRNVLIVNERHGRLDREKTAHALRLVRALPVAIDTGTEEELLLQLPANTAFPSMMRYIWSWPCAKNLRWPHSMPRARKRRTCRGSAVDRTPVT